MRIILDRSALYDGRRVYVKDLDVFGRVSPYMTRVICEAPMPGYVYMITDDSVLYDDSIGDRDGEDEHMVTRTGRTIPRPPTDPEQRRLWKIRYFSDLYGMTDEEMRRVMYVKNQLHGRPRWFYRIGLIVWIGVIAAVVYFLRR